MKLILCGFLILLCSLATASPVPVLKFDFWELPIVVTDVTCQLSRLKKPSVPNVEDILFELRTPCKTAEYLVAEAEKLRDSPDFDAKKKTAVFVSGFNSDMDASYTEELTQAYRCRGEYNFIVVNTLNHIKGLDYIGSAFNTKRLGEFIATGLKKLNIPGKDIHLIGHSLGAHIMGNAGNYFSKISNDKIGRITGLDPARPCFVTHFIIGTVFRRLTANDATFVDVIHSNSKEAGTEEAIGHTDFYPGGLVSTQPGCAILAIFCSHIKSINYFTESVYKGNEKNFIGNQCESSSQLDSMSCSGKTTPMGFAADPNVRGIFNLEVGKAAPYGRSATGRKVERCEVCKK